MENNKDASPILVSGDICIDWNLAYSGTSAKGTGLWGMNRAARSQSSSGGSALLAALLEVIVNDLHVSHALNLVVHHQAVPVSDIGLPPGGSAYTHVYSLWAQHKYGEKPPLDRESPAWRIKERLGVERPAPASAVKPAWIPEEPSSPALIVLEDDNLGFRDSPEGWPAAITTRAQGSSPWVLLKMSAPIAQGSLWEQLHKQDPNHLIVLTTIDDLRLTEVQISRELSWERTAQDVFWELVHNPCVYSLSHCAHVIVSFGAAGAILLSRKRKEKTASECSLFFDPKVVEGMWELEHPGEMLGSTACIAAGIARQIMIDPKKPDIHLGIRSGLASLRDLHLEGYGERGVSASRVNLTFPLQRISTLLAQDSEDFPEVPVQDPMRFIRQPEDSADKPLQQGFWTILQDRFPGSLDKIAEQIVLNGPEGTLEGVPLGQFGNLLTVDRQEIESFRSIRSLVGEYCRQDQQKRPLSIAVFGSPGSGKSFGVIEVANSLLPGRIEVRELNLSQFGSPTDLLAALHQVRDIGLGGKIPLIFWDEFDSAFNGEPLGWLRYFLAPMQDGRFQEGQISHPIGRAIFVFAGGTASAMSEFGRGLAPEVFRAVKGPDFISRLKGYVNILGANPVRTADGKPAEDPYCIIRRAILLRSLLKRVSPQLFEKGRLNIDRGVLRALLNTREYRHGVRSIEAILAMSQLVGKNSFERSSLPAEAQLELHVDGQNFLALVQQLELTGETLDALAQTVYEVFSARFKKKDDSGGHSSRSFSDLSDEEKDQNRQNALDIPAKLSAVGYVMIPARSNERPFNFPGEDLECLAILEHDRWVRSKTAAGWAWAAESDPANKLHKDLVSWDQLSVEEKDKDRELICGIPRILARAGYAIVKIN